MVAICFHTASSKFFGSFRKNLERYKKLQNFFGCVLFLSLRGTENSHLASNFFNGAMRFLGIRFKIAVRRPQKFQGPYFYAKNGRQFLKMRSENSDPLLVFVFFFQNFMEKPYEISDGTFLEKNEIDFWRIHTDISNPFVFEQNSIWDLLQTLTTISGSILLRQKRKSIFENAHRKFRSLLVFFFFVQTCMEKAFKISDGIFSTKK